MAAYELKVQECNSFSVHKVGCISWSSVYTGTPKIGSNDSERMNLLGNLGQASKGQKLPSFMSLYGLPAKGVAQTRGEFSQLKKTGLRVCLSATKIWIRNISSISN